MAQELKNAESGWLLSEHLNRQQAAKALGISAKWLSHLNSIGIGPHSVLIGNRLMFTLESLQDFLKQAETTNGRAGARRKRGKARAR